MAKKSEGGPTIGHNGGPKITDWVDEDFDAQTPRGKDLRVVLDALTRLMSKGGSSRVLGWVVLAAIAGTFSMTAEEFILWSMSRK